MKALPPFEVGKRTASRWLRGETKSTLLGNEPPDQNILALLKALNNLPFLYTIHSCGGHIRTEKEVYRLLCIPTSTSSNFAKFRYSGPWFSFAIRDCEESEKLIEDLESFLRQYKDASIKKFDDAPVYAVTLSSARSAEWLHRFEANALAHEAHTRIMEITLLVKEHRRTLYAAAN